MKSALNGRLRFAFPLVAALVPALACAEPPRKPAVAELFEDDVEGLLGKLKNRKGEGRAEKGEVFGGKAAYFDHIYFGRTVEDLDRIDATGALDAKPKALALDELSR